MPKAGRYHEGVPCWVALAVPDVDRAERFYGALLGWEFVATGPAEAIATLHGAQVAVIGPPSTPAAWITYLATPDVGHTATAVRAAGGRLLREPYEVPDQGRAALAADPLGAVFGLWQGGPVPGAGLVNEPGTFTWNEHLSPSPDSVRTFYRQVFGYTYDQPRDGYTVFRSDGLPAGGIGPADAHGPGAWLTSFATADADRATTHLRTLGGTVLTGPEPTPFGRAALVRDDSGAVFSLIAVPPDESAEAA
ncbi:VOC family protein [Streptomyces kaniharaensis]|uniref:VOC family protein n=1 Tax=Streptomyces kaniharaensis TaxID=212423 RepID=A0A6N7L0V6_9ACTN|nr:VOC family protein [Streptomyces kaniharaensis]MQS15433.1 VOC family protein [Streptomyces kaniharaensis]